ncbi:MAG: hypothetical protein IPH86_08040 [bacterium]|nr:hypothetical protein [bacterium]MBK7772385.1 hypothetical protein [bacterium]
MDRRQFLTGLVAGAVSLTLLPQLADAATPARRRRRRRRVRRRIRRRVRRRVALRMVRGRRFWVVPVGLVVGWELMHEDRVVVVREIKMIEVEGVKTEVAVVVDPNARVEAGKPEAFEEIPILREDNQDNAVELEGTRLADDDKSTPGIEAEIEEEVEVDE